MMMRLLLAGLTLVASSAGAEPLSPDPSRHAELVRLVRHDCGSCHGLELTGGLGPALTPAALAGRPVETIVSVIVDGRAGTAMPPWRAFLTDAEARAIARALQTGFPK